ncbi:MAG: HD domain-containing phosphohydrolase [Acidimicrobiales bacterium]
MELTLESVLPVCGAIGAISMGWMLVDPDRIVRDANPSVSNLLGLTRDKLIGCSLDELSWATYSEAGERLAVDEGPIGRAARSREPVLDETIGLRVEGGTSRWVTVSAFPYVIDGVVVAVAVAYSDVTGSVVARRSWDALLDLVHRSHHVHTRGEYFAELCASLVDRAGYALVVVTGGVGSETSYVYGAGLSGEFQRVLAETDPAAMRGEGLIGQAMRTGRVQVANNLAAEPTVTYWQEHIERLHVRSAAAFPFTLGSETLTLTVFSYLDHHFDDRVVDGIAMMVDEVAAGVTQIDASEQVQRALAGTLLALSEMSELRDPYTAGHQRNVGRLAAAIAATMGVEAGLVRLIDQAGTVHDIGKIVIPAEILTRPGRLSVIEFEIMRSHPDVGYNLLTKAHLPWPIPEVARQHHERLDGSGYPLGLGGDDIELPSRIVAVADVVEAMAHHRPYRAAPGLDAALAEIARGAGLVYDHDAADACRAVFDDGFDFLAASSPNVDVPEPVRASS